MCAALGNTEEDHWEWHWFDTVKGGDYLVDQDAAEVMCHDAVETVINLEHLGLPFNRTPEGLIDQRRFGGHTRDYGERHPCGARASPPTAPGTPSSRRSTSSASSTTSRSSTSSRSLDLLMPGGPREPIGGVIAIELATSEIHSFRARAVLFATGGFGKMFKVTSNAHTLTGDGVAIAVPARPPARGHGVLPVPPDRHVQAGLPAVRGDARRGRLPRQRRGRAVHGALRADDEGPRQPRRRVAHRSTWRSPRGGASAARTTSTSTCGIWAPRSSTRSCRT